MNPRLVRAGVRRRVLHADVPARPGKDQDDEGQAQEAGQHVEVAGYPHRRARRNIGYRGTTSRHSGPSHSHVS